ncbi:MAG: SurA N-terminal domain-containing protein [Deltaproteobacteria bacterium]|nr:SurA N-terminal domain-containing protein [Deltaproteobacteria bacterium]
MLLSLMRKHAQSWIIKFMITIIALVFIFYFGYSFRSDDRIKVAEVNGEPISRVLYEKAYSGMLNNLREEYKSVWNDKLIEAFDLENRALEGLIEQKIISQEAERLGLMVTKNEIQQKIIEIPAFITDGRFDENRYRSLLSYSRTTPEAFEEDLAKDLLQQKIMQFITTFLVPSNQEVLDNYRFANEKIKLGFVKFSPDEYKSSISKEKEAVNAFFEERKENYRIPEKIKTAYIKINPEMFYDKVELNEDQLMEYYEENISTFSQEQQVKARHILFRVDSDASPEDQKKIEEKAVAVLERIKKGEDFAELAKEFSEDSSKSQGGDLGYFPRGRMVREFEDAAFSLKKDEVSDLVKSDFGYHIIKVDDIKDESVKSYPEVRDEIEKTMRQIRASDMAQSKAMDLIDQMPYDIDLKEYAAEHEVPWNSMDFFSRSEPAPLIMNNSKLVETLFSLEKGDVTEVLELNGDFYIMQVTDKKDSYLPELDEVYVSVEMDFIDHMALKSARDDAEKYLAALKENSKWEELAKEKNKTVESTEFFSRRGAPGKIGAIAGLQDAAFKLNAENPFADRVFDNTSGAFVIKWEAKQDIDEAKYLEEKERYEKALVQTKQQVAFSDWIDKIKAKSDIDRSYFEKYR